MLDRRDVILSTSTRLLLFHFPLMRIFGLKSESNGFRLLRVALSRKNVAQFRQNGELLTVHESVILSNSQFSALLAEAD
jgi:hypothetical protein